MKNTALMLCLTVAITAGLATESMAAGDKRHGPAFEEVDANADGLLTREEMQAHRAARFAETDTDGSGTLTREEVEARMKNAQGDRRAKFLDRMFERRDDNGDGVLSLEEMSSGKADKMFKRADADGDGMISESEFDAARVARGSKKQD